MYVLHQLAIWGSGCGLNKHPWNLAVHAWQWSQQANLFVEEETILGVGLIEIGEVNKYYPFFTVSFDKDRI